jgi:hypothetical protein
MTVIRVDWELRRAWVFDRREHHGEVGAVLALAGLIGLVLVWHDWHDRHLWFRRHP